jgi:hypothetical protein
MANIPWRFNFAGAVSVANVHGMPMAQLPDELGTNILLAANCQRKWPVLFVQDTS